MWRQTNIHIVVCTYWNLAYIDGISTYYGGRVDGVVNQLNNSHNPLKNEKIVHKEFFCIL